MRIVPPLVAVCAICASPLKAEDLRESERTPDSAEPFPSSFDLAKADLAERSEVSAVEPEVPRGMDLREFAWDPPAVAIPLAVDGPVFAAGAMGARFKDAPKLAHIAIGWDF